MANEQKTLKQRVYQEFKEYLALSLYLWIFLGMFEVFKSVVLAEHSIDFATHGFAIINALVLAKFMLLVKALHPGKHVEDAPLVYPTLLKSAIFALVLMVLKILEDTTVGHFRGKTISGSIADLGGGHLNSILVLTLMLFVVLIPLTAFGELERVLGEGKVSNLFLRPRDLSKPFGQKVV